MKKQIFTLDLKFRSGLFGLNGSNRNIFASSAPTPLAITSIGENQVLMTFNERKGNPLREKFTDIIVVEIRRNYDRRSPEEFRLITEEAVRLFKLGIIEESVSDYLSIPFLQKTKMARPDYRAVNEQ
ncbi:hypothetical protein ACTA71_009827 [Dictyostelium dimigraforme]